MTEAATTPAAPPDGVSVDSDIHDVFRAMYDGDEWDDSDDDADAEDKSADEQPPARVISRADLLAALDSLLVPVARKRRIYAQPAPVPRFTPSTLPIPQLPPVNTFAPFSPLPLLARLRTFVPGSTSQLLPAAIAPIAAALHGWVSSGLDGFACASGCAGTWGVGGLNALPHKVRAEVVRRLAAGLSSRHAPGCPWRVCSSPAELPRQLRTALHPLVALSLAPLARALQARTLSSPEPPRISSPATADQVDALRVALERYEAARRPDDVLAPLSADAVRLAWFGWYPLDPSFPAKADHVAPLLGDDTGTHTDIVSCRVCQRRVGLWTFRARELDVLAAHTGWCPLGSGGEEKWWAACPLLAPPSKEEVVRLVVSERPTKRWRR